MLWKTGERKGSPSLYISQILCILLLYLQFNFHIHLWQQENLWAVSISSSRENGIKRQKLKLTDPIKWDSEFLAVSSLPWRSGHFSSHRSHRKLHCKVRLLYPWTGVDFNTHCNWNSLFSKDFIYFLKRGERGREKGGETLMWERNIDLLPLMHPQPGTWPATQARALTRNRTSDFSVCSVMPNPQNHSSQGCNWNSLNSCFNLRAENVVFLI